MWPSDYRRFVEQHALAGKEIEIPVEADPSGVGATLRLYDEASARSEADEFYPGLVVKRDGFVPIGECLIGSGDPYFVNVHDEQPGPVYRIYHDAVADDGYDRDAAVARVLPSYELLLQYVS